MRQRRDTGRCLWGPRVRAVAGGWSWLCFPSGLLRTVVIEGDRVGSWSQDGGWSVKPSLILMFGRRWWLLVVLTGLAPVGPCDGRVLAVVQLSLWGPSSFHVGEAGGCKPVLQWLFSPVLLILLNFLFTVYCCLFFMLVVGSVMQISNKSILCRVSGVVVNSGERLASGSCFVVNSIQSYCGCVPWFYTGFLQCVSFLACVEVAGRSWDGPPNRLLLRFDPVPVIATFFGQFSTNSYSSQSSSLDFLTRQSLYFE